MTRFDKILTETIFLLLIGLLLSSCMIFQENNMKKSTDINNETVVLIHGMGRTKFSMIMLKKFLKDKGYETVSFSYSSTQYSVKELSAKFADFLIKTAEKNPNSKIHIVSHSLGGILTRGALEKIKNTANTPINMGRVVMLAPPNKGSKAADFFSQIWPIPQILKPISDLKSSPDSSIHQVPVPENIEIGIIAGRYDAKVSPEESHLKTESDHIIVNSAHSFIMNNSIVQKAVHNFLKTGQFGRKKRE